MQLFQHKLNIYALIIDVFSPKLPLILFWVCLLLCSLFSFGLTKFINCMLFIGMQCLIGHKYKPVALPTCINSADFKHIFSVANEAGLGDVSLLNHCYRENENLQPSTQYSLVRPRRTSRQYEEEIEHITKIVEYGAKVAQREGILSENFEPVLSAVHRQILHALKLVKSHNSTDRLLCFIRQFEGKLYSNYLTFVFNFIKTSFESNCYKTGVFQIKTQTIIQ